MSSLDLILSTIFYLIYNTISVHPIYTLVFNGSKYHVKPCNVAIHRWQCRRISASLPTFPSSPSDENHAQIASDINGKPGGNIEGRAGSCSQLPTKSAIHKTSLSSITDFFHDNTNMPYVPRQEHALKRSSCNAITAIKQGYFHCRLHHDVKYVHLISIEHHVKYKDPEKHKSELLRFPKLTHG